MIEYEIGDHARVTLLETLHLIEVLIEQVDLAVAVTDRDEMTVTRRLNRRDDRLRQTKHALDLIAEMIAAFVARFNVDLVPFVHVGEEIARAVANARYVRGVEVVRVVREASMLHAQVRVGQVPTVLEVG